MSAARNTQAGNGPSAAEPKTNSKRHLAITIDRRTPSPLPGRFSASSTTPVGSRQPASGLTAAAVRLVEFWRIDARQSVSVDNFAAIAKAGHARGSVLK